ncbi:hypothetical protein GLOIN_2v1631678 [Rhizophagus irregularis DAOM 181602=DAOM 197198]|uniref:Uncharacterized protein n=2 Tax=Rhizophagus irregularis TaxID=588596 RepID=U9UJN9_RHIID|nr:hypothetical protein GLOIN_2v1631678 [Rhizophagus irregularis DAOM 181602=DAOM 197198]EXX68468.1 hypothetical protein RirG_104810 [Rhizophagus irregularis DAOM 197198w]POG68892.1 hypothetical protein GLOIN_2v1631678 [Rhizophagus irregularis DAOM 181602=DAOM 197198]CAG8584707.1 5922_t:CDS:2 [Rhizophagus irregularis]|eukprot:XP_025175758.1 hypothetical protein GLOIN_2v1631678 [Rhizophagus irregularis DAOM 181602=DAOM 197198]
MIEKVRFDKCCLCISLQFGAYVAAIWFAIWNFYIGGLVIKNKDKPRSVNAYEGSAGIIIGVFYISLGFAALCGIHGIYYKKAGEVKVLTKFAFISLLVYVLFSIIEIILLLNVVGYQKYCRSLNPKHPSYYEYCYPFARWGITFAVGIIFGGYLSIVLRSYSKKLKEQTPNVFVADMTAIMTNTS